MRPIKIKRRIIRRMSDEDRERHKRIIAEVEADLPAIMARAREVFARHDRLLCTIAALKEERQRKQMSLAELARRSGIDRARLSRLEKDPRANPTLDTLSRIAAALGKDILITLADAPAKAG